MRPVAFDDTAAGKEDEETLCNVNWVIADEESVESAKKESGTNAYNSVRAVIGGREGIVSAIRGVAGAFS